VNLGAQFTGFELGVDGVVADGAVGAAGIAGDAAKGLEQFEKANIFVASTINDRKGVIDGGRVDGELFLVGGSGGGEQREDGEQQDEKISSSRALSIVALRNGFMCDAKEFLRRLKPSMNVTRISQH